MESRLRDLTLTVNDSRDRLVRLETTLSHLATHHALEKATGELRADLTERMGGMRADLIERIENVRSDMIKWFVGTAVILSSLAFAAARVIH